ncbi:MAG: recombinase family protein [Dehalococcoidia bacterium]
MRAIGYFRETDGDGGSLAEQSRSFLEFCRANGYEAAAAFLDVTREDEELPGYRQLLDFLKHQGQRGFLIVAISALAALGRGLPEAARRYFQLNSLGVQVVSIANGDDPGTTLIDIWARERKGKGQGERVRAAMRQKAVKGEVLGRPPYGYKVGPKRRLQIVPQEGSVVRHIFRLYLKEGLGIRRIARRLNEEGLRTRRGGLWSMVTVRDILRNRAYLGTYSRFGVRVPASHPPLISPVDFRRVQERLDERRPSAVAREASPFLLSGLVRCGYCGNKMIGVTRKQRWQRRSDGSQRAAQYRYYQCESRTNRSLCDYHTQRVEELEERVRQALLGQDKASKPALPVAGDQEAVLVEVEAQCRRLRDRSRRLNRRLEQYMEAAASGRIDAERLRSLSLALAEEQLAVDEVLAEAMRAAQQQATEAERRRLRQRSLARLHNEWSRLDFSQKRELLRELIDRVIVRDDGIETVLRP